MTRNAFLFLSVLWLSASAQADVAKDIDGLFSEYDEQSPGCSVAASRNGKLILSRSYGMAHLEHNIPNQTKTRFYVASISKQFTAAAVALLILDRELSLDDEVRSYVPELPDYGTPIRVHHLVHHTSGLRDYPHLLILSGRNLADSITADEVFDLIVRQSELNFEPGSDYLYTNSGYFLLAELVERITGKSPREFAEERIFEPLGLNNSQFHDDHLSLIPNRAEGYLGSGEPWQANRSRYALIGSGGLFTTVEDLLRWDESFYHDTLGDGVSKLMHTFVGGVESGRSIDYGFGFIRGEYRGLTTISHGGGGPAYRSFLVRFPGQHFSAALTCNLEVADARALIFDVVDVLLEPELLPVAKPEKIEREVAKVDLGLYDDYSGIYELAPGFHLIVTREEDRLFAQATNQVKVEIFPESSSKFFYAVVDAQITFVHDDSGNVSELVLDQPGRQRRGRRLGERHDGEIPLETYAGCYNNEDLDVTYRFYVHDEALRVRIGRRKPVALERVVGDTFTLPDSSLSFGRDVDGNTVDFVMDTSRVRNLRFTRIE